MATTDVRTTYTPAEYLELERAAETKSEYTGQIYAMTGASLAHNRIVVNVSGELRRLLRGGPCEAFANDLRVRVSATGLYTYPDIAVACGEIVLDDDHFDTLLNPVVVIEVLSPSTEAYDRGEKFAHYRRLESLQEYILVAQDQIRVERYVRQGEHWLLSELSAPDDILEIAAIGCGVRLTDIYERVKLPNGDPSLASADGTPTINAGDPAGEG